MLQVGAYTGTTPATLAAYQTWLGRPLDNVLVSINQTSWTAFDSSIAWDVGQWKPTGTSLIWSVPLTVTGTSLAQTATGAYDSHYLAAATALASSEPGTGPIYVRVGWEFNLAGQPWAAQGNEAAFIQSDRNLVDTFRSVSSRFKFVWDPNIGGSYDPAKAYPGDSYVDVVGADVYYNPQWDGTDAKAAFANKVSEPYGLQWQQDFAAAHGKPTAISEWGVDTDASGPYIQAMHQWLVDHAMIYANYWESDAAYSGALHTGDYPSAAAAYQQAFGPAAATAPAIPTVSGSVDTSTLGTGPVVVDLPGGVVTKGGVTALQLSTVTTVTAGQSATTVYGLKAGADRIVGGAGTLGVYGQGAADMVQGGTGNVTLWCGSGSETLQSGGGINVMYGGTGPNRMIAGTATTSRDTFYGTSGTDVVTGGNGTVTSYAGSGTDTLNGGGGTNVLFASSGTNTLNGLMTPDSQGLIGTNILYGGTGAHAGVDLFYAGAGTNLLYEGSGTDYFASDAGTDTIYGGSGRSFIYGGTGSQTIFTGAGNQYVQAGGGVTKLFETAANLKAGRFDEVDGFAGGKATDLYIPSAYQASTSFVAQGGGTAVLIATGGGQAELFVSQTAMATVAAHTHFT